MYPFVLTKQAFFPAEKVLKVSGIIPVPSEIQSDSSKINKRVFLQLFCGNQAKADMLQNWTDCLSYQQWWLCFFTVRAKDMVLKRALLLKHSVSSDFVFAIVFTDSYVNGDSCLQFLNLDAKEKYRYCSYKFLQSLQFQVSPDHEIILNIRILNQKIELLHK